MALSEILDAPAILCGTSRLVIDCNRHLYAKDLIPESSDRTTIPGNLNLTSAERTDRISRWFQPYHHAIETILDERGGRGLPTLLVSIHSMTPILGDAPRPWQIALSSYLDRRVVEPVLATLRRSGEITVGDNQPYNLDPQIDYTVPFHALRRSLPHLQVEFRQDEIETATTQSQWAIRFAQALP
jgi:predicted N-formylglutamate amidohydrolase